MVTDPIRRETTGAEVDASLAALNAMKSRFAQTSLRERIALAEACISGVQAVAHEWVEAACRAKGIPEASTARAEEISTGPVATVRYLRLLIHTLHALEETGAPPVPRKIVHSAAGRLGVQTIPADGLYDPITLFGFQATTWLQHGVTVENVHDYAGALPAIGSRAQAKIALVLGAGNVSTIGPTDALFRIFHAGQVVLLKMNPVNDYLGPIFERVFAPLINAGCLRLIYGGGPAGEYAVHHSLVDEIHITGSRETHHSIVWGASGPERVRRLQAGEPLLRKPITSELGNVTPWIIVPGNYSPRQLEFQAENVASSIVNNASFNCVATKVIVTWKGWPQREEFLNKLQEILDGTPARVAYYPGAEERYRHVMGGREESKPRQLDHDGKDSRTLPWTLVRNVDPASSPKFFEEESFVCVCAETALDAASDADFLYRAVDFANNTLRGTLAAAITVPPRFRRRNAQLWEASLARLRYGVVTVNHWPGLAYTLMSIPWGGYPGATIADTRSGLGFVHNTYMLRGVEKTVLEGPLTMFPKPFWFPTHSAPEPIVWKLLDLYCHPSFWRLQTFLGSALAEQFVTDQSAGPLESGLD